jgi:predicted nucleotidyltransferase
MRLSSHQQEKIRQAAARVLGSKATIRLFGSRTDDALRGGDIDLFIETDKTLANRAKTLCDLYGALVFALGDRKIDILLKDAKTPDQPIFKIARQTGIRL